MLSPYGTDLIGIRILDNNGLGWDAAPTVNRWGG